MGNEGAIVPDVRDSFFKKLKEQGFKKVCRSGFSHLYDKYFDIKYGLDTYSWVSVKDLDVTEDQKKHAVLYQATKALPLRRLFKKLSIPREYELIDIGCGKGRVLIMAAEYGFKSVKGVEISESLCLTAQSNFLKYKRKTNINTNFQIYNTDATNFQYSDNEMVFFLYNPFDNVILESVLKNISESLERNPRKVWMIYANAVHRELVESSMRIMSTKEYNFLEFEFVVYEVESQKNLPNSWI